MTNVLADIDVQPGDLIYQEDSPGYWHYYLILDITYSPLIERNEAGSYRLRIPVYDLTHKQKTAFSLMTLEQGRNLFNPRRTPNFFHVRCDRK